MNKQELWNLLVKVERATYKARIQLIIRPEGPGGSLLDDNTNWVEVQDELENALSDLQAAVKMADDLGADAAFAEPTETSP